MTNRNLLRILFVEDLPSDSDLAVLELRKEGLQFEHMRVDSRDDLIKALTDFKPDIVISDYMMPSYDGMSALNDAREFNPLIPFILYTGSMNEETAVECIKAGATDYIIKEHMTRLPFAVKEALEQHRILIEKRASELLLKENEAKLQSIFSAAPVGIGLVVGKVFIEVNDTFCRMTGYDRKELLGKNADAIYAADERNESAGIVIYRHIAEKGTGSVETHFKCKDGKILNIFLSSIPLDKDDLTKGVTFIAMDITERVKAEEALENEKDLIYSLMSSLPDHIYFKDLESRFIMINKSHARFFGLDDPRKAIGKTDSDFFSGEHAKQAYEDEQNIISTGLPLSKEEKETHHNRPDTWVSTVKMPLKDKDGKIIGTFGISRDITDKKQAEVTLRKSEERYRRIFENIHDLFYETSIEGTIIEVSPSVEILSKGQYKRGDLIGKSINDYYSDPMEREALLNVLRENGFVSDYEITLKNRDESSIPCSISAKIIFDVNGQPEKIIGSMRDITDRKIATKALMLAKEKAEAGDKLKTTFLNNISHEVRTPLNGILGFVEIMSHTDLTNDDKDISRSMLLESCDRLLNTITNYMDISLITSNNLFVNRKDFEPEEIMKESLEKYKTKCSARKLELLLKIPEHSGKLSIYSDPEIFSKIISHLLSNAIKFTEKGNIQYGYAIRKNELEFFVKDPGIGVGKESLESIFDCFVKEDLVPLKVTEGSGIGLSISKGMVNILGGKIWVESERGKGSCFFFTLPINKESESHILNTKTGIRKKNKRPNSILVAEDDEINFFYLKSLLGQITSANIIHASNGKEAIEILKENPDIGLVLMDIKMPVMDGYTAVRLIRESKSDVPIIAQTAYVDNKTKALEIGCNGFLSKPFDKQKLLSVVKEFINIQ